MASVERFGWWTASDVPNDLMLQLWLKIIEKLLVLVLMLVLYPKRIRFRFQLEIQ